MKFKIYYCKKYNCDYLVKIQYLMLKIISRNNSILLICRKFSLFNNNSDKKLLVTDCRYCLRNYSTASAIIFNNNNNYYSSKSAKIFKMACNMKSSTTPSTSTETKEKKFTNRLINEKSPYLLQHAHNPVDWYPWGDEAIEKAKTENKLIFLSVGYSTCHWCHVMEHESFENEEIAKVLNENFINIKVDREERPDIDRIYMNVLLILNGSGGWPMSVFLTPDLNPITAGSYFPPTDRWGMPGFKTIINNISGEWKKNKEQLHLLGSKFTEGIRKAIKQTNLNIDNNSNSIENRFNKALRIYNSNFDAIYGGFGTTKPKFPEVSKLNFLLHAFTIKKDLDIIQLVLKTLKYIGNGGIHDHIFGGFSRYSVDRKWHIPHFEKMLYDQAQLMTIYSNVFKVTRKELYLDIADGIYRYITKDLKHPKGGFYSGEDADSAVSFDEPNKKVEGAFYAWTLKEIEDELNKNSTKFSKILSNSCDMKKILDIYKYHYDLRDDGNVEPSSDPHGHLGNKNILFVRDNLEITANQFEIDVDVLKEILNIANNILHELRDKRPRPHLDTKIITSWNGLILSGLSKLSTSTNCDNKRSEYLKTATELINFLKLHVYDANKKTLLRSCYGEGINSDSTELLAQPIFGFLDDYSFLIRGLLDYYEATHDLNVLKWAKDLQDTQDKLFWDKQNGGYFYSQENSPNLIVRLKEDHDGAEPCGNSVSSKNLLLLSIYYGDDDSNQYKEKLQKLFNYYQNNNDDTLGYILPELMSALLLHDRGMEIASIIGGNINNCDKTIKFLNILRKYYILGMVILHYDHENPTDIRRKTMEKFKMFHNEPTVYVCHNKVCQLPIIDPVKLDEAFMSKYVLKGY